MFIILQFFLQNGCATRAGDAAPWTTPHTPAFVDSVVIPMLFPLTMAVQDAEQNVPTGIQAILKTSTVHKCVGNRMPEEGHLAYAHEKHPSVLADPVQTAMLRGQAYHVYDRYHHHISETTND